MGMIQVTVLSSTNSSDMYRELALRRRFFGNEETDIVGSKFTATIEGQPGLLDGRVTSLSFEGGVNLETSIGRILEWAGSWRLMSDSGPKIQFHFTK
jgi:hypothetical protein